MRVGRRVCFQDTIEIGLVKMKPVWRRLQTKMSTRVRLGRICCICRLAKGKSQANYTGRQHWLLFVA